jgi:hypothetical protein
MLGGNSGKTSGSSGNQSKVNKEGGSTFHEHNQNLISQPRPRGFTVCWNSF